MTKLRIPLIGGAFDGQSLPTEKTPRHVYLESQLYHRKFIGSHRSSYCYYVHESLDNAAAIELLLKHYKKP